MTLDEESRHQRRRVDDNQRRSSIKKAWDYVYLKGKGVTGRDVDNILSSKSLVPVHVSVFLKTK